MLNRHADLEVSLNIDLNESVDRIKLFRTILHRDIEHLVKTEKECAITWPAYCATVDSLKEFICAMAGYVSQDEASQMSKDDEIHDLACNLADLIFKWLR